VHRLWRVVGAVVTGWAVGGLAAAGRRALHRRALALDAKRVYAAGMTMTQTTHPLSDTERIYVRDAAQTLREHADCYGDGVDFSAAQRLDDAADAGRIDAEDMDMARTWGAVFDGDE
jgi:hypothetical protein